MTEEKPVKKERLNGRLGMLSHVVCDRCLGVCDNKNGFIYFPEINSRRNELVCENCDKKREAKNPSNIKI